MCGGLPLAATQGLRGAINACLGLINTIDGPSFQHTFSLAGYRNQPRQFGEEWSHSHSWAKPRPTNHAPCAAMERLELPTF